MFYFAVPVDMDMCALGFAMDTMIHSDQIYNLHNGNCKQCQSSSVLPKINRQTTQECASWAAQRGVMLRDILCSSLT